MTGLKTQVARAKKKHPKRAEEKFVPLPLREYRPDLVPVQLQADVKYTPYKAPKMAPRKGTYAGVLLRLLREGDFFFMRWAAKDAKAKKIAAKHSIKLPKITVRKKVRK